MMGYREGRWIPWTMRGKSTRKRCVEPLVGRPETEWLNEKTQLGGASRLGLQWVARSGTSRAQAALLQLIICAQGQPDIPVDLGLLLILSFNLPRAQVSAVWPSTTGATSLSLFYDLQNGGNNNLNFVGITWGNAHSGAPQVHGTWQILALLATSTVTVPVYDLWSYLPAFTHWALTMCLTALSTLHVFNSHNNFRRKQLQVLLTLEQCGSTYTTNFFQ